MGGDRVLDARVDHAKVFTPLEKARACSPDLYNQKCSAVFEHVCESYPKPNVGVCKGGMSIRTCGLSAQPQQSSEGARGTLRASALRWISTPASPSNAPITQSSPPSQVLQAKLVLEAWHGVRTPDFPRIIAGYCANSYPSAAPLASPFA